MDNVVDQLRRDLTELRAEVASLRARVAVLEGAQEFEVISIADTQDQPAASSSPSHPTEAERIAAAKETGRFFARCLRGESRGLSGRERVRLASRIYVLVRDISGTVSTDPVRVFYSYSELKPFVCRNPSFGDSVFAGFASKWEAKAAVVEAGYRWPA